MKECVWVLSTDWELYFTYFHTTTLQQTQARRHVGYGTTRDDRVEGGIIIIIILVIFWWWWW
jgi:hypothetical protein